MSDIQVLYPIGGVGKRFTDEGFLTPKPLIPVNGVPMIKRAMQTFDQFGGEISFFSVIREEHQEKYNLAQVLREISPNIKVMTFQGDTRGPVETALYSEQFLELDQPLIVMDCDISFISPSFFDSISSPNEEVSGALLTFKSSENRYSYVELDSQGYALRTAEKEVISENAIVGAYYFSRARYFVESARNLLTIDLNSRTPEYYLSSVYNLLIDSGHKIVTHNAIFQCFGTPEELLRFELWEKNNDCRK